MGWDGVGWGAHLRETIDNSFGILAKNHHLPLVTVARLVLLEPAGTPQNQSRSAPCRGWAEGGGVSVEAGGQSGEQLRGGGAHPFSSRHCF